MKSLNHIYRTIWSEALGAWIAVSEITRTKGKRSASSLIRVIGISGGNAAADSSIFEVRLKPICLALACCFAFGAQANPMDGTVVNGQAIFSTNGNTLTVTNTPGTIINWQGFSINANEVTHFAQQSASSTVLNHVVTNNPSVILGTLSSNGQVYLVNANGIMFGAGSTVDVAGLVATTLNLSDADFLAGRHNFTAVPGAQNINNAGNINAQQGGHIYLIAPNVENNGIIKAPNGEILLAAGNSVELVNSNDPNLRVQITAPAGDVTNIGQLIVGSGSLGLFGAVVRNSGIASADSATMQGGKIVFRSSQRTEAGGTISASGVGGGEIKILSDMQSGAVQVSGTLDASAPVSGNGGFIDTSAAHVQVLDSAHVTTAAANGTAGNWLIDPTDFYIWTSDPLDGSSGMTGALLGGQLAFSNITVQTSPLGSGNGDIFVNDAVSWNSGTTLLLNAHRNVEINALISSGTPGIYNPGNLSVHADMDATGTGTILFGVSGQVTLQGGTLGNVYGSAQFFYNPSSYANPTDFTPNVTANLIAWMLVNNVNNLQSINTNLAGDYALGNHIDALLTAGWNAGAGFVPIGNAATPFVGRFNGGGFSINNLYINSAGGDAGLFGVIGEAGRVYSVSLAGGSVSASGNNIGGLAGTNYGQIFNSNVSDMDVSGSGLSNNVGGFVGRNVGGVGQVGGANIGPSTPGLPGAIGADATISNSYVNGGVVSGYANVGGFVGLNQGGNGGAGGFGTISGTGGAGGAGGTAQLVNVYASGGTVSGMTNVGGLAGLNADGVTGATGGGTLPGAGGTAGTASASASFWDIDTTAQAGAFGTNLSVVTSNVVGIHSSTATIDAFAQATYAGWDFTNTWWMSDGDTRPFLRSEFNTSIGNSHQLQLMMLNMSGNYSLNNNIDMTSTSSTTGMWNTSGFVPIGNPLAPPYNFTGSFNGNNHIISNLYINRLNDYVGLFGAVFNSASTISNVGLVNADVTGNNNVGGLVGLLQRGQVTNSYVNGTVTGSNNVGGLVGQIIEGGGIAGSFVAGSTVSGSGANVGGLVGEIFAGTVATSYVGASNVSGGSNVGGLVGASLGGNAISDIAYSLQTSISNSFVSGGTVTGLSGDNIGGLVGQNRGGNGASGGGMVVLPGDATITGSYVLGVAVTGSANNVGGFAGLNRGGDGGAGQYSGSILSPGENGGAGGNATISSSYVSGGTVSGGTYVGAYVGRNMDGNVGVDGIGLYPGLGGLGGIAKYEEGVAPLITLRILSELVDTVLFVPEGKGRRHGTRGDTAITKQSGASGSAPALACR